MRRKNGEKNVQISEISGANPLSQWFRNVKIILLLCSGARSRFPSSSPALFHQSALPPFIDVIWGQHKQPKSAAISCFSLVPRVACHFGSFLRLLPFERVSIVSQLGRWLRRLEDRRWEVL